MGEVGVMIQREDGEKLSLIPAPKESGVWVTFEDTDHPLFPFHAAFCCSSLPIVLPQPWLLLSCLLASLACFLSLMTHEILPFSLGLSVETCH